MTQLLLCLSTILLTGCLYQKPDEDYIQTTPTTNHPDIVRSNNTNNTPGIKF